ncbi:MAG: glycosyltransferase family 2 protein [Anaerolineae bacterium]
MEFISIVIPVYNEEAAIGDDLDCVKRTMDATGRPYEVIVVNDGSTDRTEEIVASRPWVKLLRHDQNRGTGAARNTGIKAAKGDIIIMTDGDGTYPNQDMPRLLQCMEQCDMVIGARTQERGTLKWLRAPAKWFIRSLAAYLTGTQIPDLNSGFRAFKRDIALKYLRILPTTHSWVSTITIAFLSDGYVVKYIPIDYYKRKGRSKFHPIRDTYNYLTLVVRTVTYFNPLKVFMPVSLLLLAVGALKALYDIVAYRFHFAPSTLLLLLTAIQIAVLGLLADLIVRRVGR